MYFMQNLKTSDDETIGIPEWSNFFSILLLQNLFEKSSLPLFLFSLLSNAMLKLILTGTFIKYLELHPKKG